MIGQPGVGPHPACEAQLCTWRARSRPDSNDSPNVWAHRSSIPSSCASRARGLGKCPRDGLIRGNPFVYMPQKLACREYAGEEGSQSTCRVLNSRLVGGVDSKLAVLAAPNLQLQGCYGDVAPLHIVKDCWPIHWTCICSPAPSFFVLIILYLKAPCCLPRAHCKKDVPCFSGSVYSADASRVG